MSIADIIQSRWADEEVPIIDGILWNDGRLFQVSYVPVRLNGVTGQGVGGVRPDPVMIVEDEVDLTSIIEMDRLDAGDGRIFTCGEGGAGGDGFVACCDSGGDRLVWVAFFQQSNPFGSLRRDHDRILATNNHGHVWSFAMNDPMDLRVEG